MSTKNDVTNINKRTAALLLMGLVILLAGCNFAVDVGPTAVEPTSTLFGSITGTVWQDLCINFEESDLLPAGCFLSSGEVKYLANGIREAGEPGIGAVQVLLGAGLCPSYGLAISPTAGDGSYYFTGLTSGEYCVTIKDAGDSGGIWTYPLVSDSDAIGRMSVSVKGGEILSNINFGRDIFETPPSTPTSTPDLELRACTDEAQFVLDVTVADGTRIERGEAFIKTWRLQNSGTCIWNADYAVVYASGYSLQGPNVMALKGIVSPGKMVDISIVFEAPGIEGSYEGYWMLRNAEGDLFGIGSDSKSPFWVAIEVGPDPEPTFADWKGEYFDNKNLNGDPVMLKNDKKIDKTWGLRSPNEDLIPRDNFSVRWTRTIKYAGRTYRFHIDITDGAKLYVDDVLVMNEWRDGERRFVSVDLTLKKGEHEIVFEYYNRSGGAVAQLRWEQVDDLLFEGWEAKYWMNRTMDSDLVLIRDEQEINFDWDIDGPVSGGLADKFSAQWKRTLTFDPGLYSLQAIADDGIRVYVDDALVIDEWHASAGAEIYEAELVLSGEHEISVLYYENAGKAKVQFAWKMIEPENHAPEVVEDAYSVIQDNLLAIDQPGVLANDLDLDGDELKASLAVEPSSGLLELREDGSFVYAPNDGFVGEDTFGYVISDGIATSEVGMVTITVFAEGDV